MITLNQANNHLTYQKSLQEYKTDELDSTNKNFNSILEHSLISARLDKSESSEKKLALNDQIAASSEQAQTTSINKPNMRELVEAISGRSVEELYADPSVNWLEISAQAGRADRCQDGAPRHPASCRERLNSVSAPYRRRAVQA